MSGLGYLLKRLLLAIPTFIGITLICFALTRILPGGPVEMRLAAMRGMGSTTHTASAQISSITEEQRAELMHKFGFDEPFFVQYGKWLFRDKMGLQMASYDYPDKTTGKLIFSRLPISLTFGITGFLLTYLICIPLGISKAIRHGSKFDTITSAIIFLGYAIPAFAFGMLLKMIFCGTIEGLFDIFPLGGFETEGTIGTINIIWDRTHHMILPIACYVIGSFAWLTLLMKNSLLEQITSDYVRTVLAKGATKKRAIWGHALRNSLIPIATGFGSIFTIIFAGSVIIESIFDIPGMGRLSLDAIAGRDYAIFMASLSLSATLQLCGNIFSDICYTIIDPRIHFGK